MGPRSGPTWLGAALFVIFMYLFTFVSNAGIDHQNDKIDRIIRQQLDTSA